VLALGTVAALLYLRRRRATAAEPAPLTEAERQRLTRLLKDEA